MTCRTQEPQSYMQLSYLWNTLAHFSMFNERLPPNRSCDRRAKADYHRRQANDAFSEKNYRTAYEKCGGACLFRVRVFCGDCGL